MLYEIEKPPKRKVNIKLIIFGLIAIAVVVGTILIVRYFSTRTMTTFSILSEVDRADSNNVTYLPFQHKILKYSKDGISMIDSNGETLWNGGYEMEKPVVDTCEECVVVTDAGAKKFFVTNGKEAGINYQTDYPVARCKVAATGEVLALLHDEDSDNLCIFNVFEDEPLEVEIPTNIDESGYTLDFDISPDGKCVVVAYLLVKNGKSENKVCFYNFKDNNYEENSMVGGATIDSKGIGDIRFLNNEEVAIFTEDGFRIFSDMKKPQETKKVKLSETPKSMAISDDKILLVSGEAADSNQKMHLYNYSGDEVLNQKISVVYSNLVMDGEDIIFSDEQTCDIYRTNGSKKFHYKFDSAFEYFFPAVEGNNYYFVDSSVIKTIKIKMS